MRRQMRNRLAATTFGGLGLLFCGGGPTSAQGQPTSLHDIPWYMAHDSARSATLNLCRSDHRFARDVDCANAETAEDRLYSQRAAKAGQLSRGRSRSSAFDDDLLSPQYWAANRLTRLSVLASCRNRVTIYQPDVCAAARQGDALDVANNRAQR